MDVVARAKVIFSGQSNGADCAERERAYHLWMESGCPVGNAEAHWLAAQREVLSASVSAFVRVPEAEQPGSLQPASLLKSAKSRKAKSK